MPLCALFMALEADVVCSNVRANKASQHIPIIGSEECVRNMTSE